LNDPVWGKSIDAARIGVAGHSQGGFTALWIGGAKVNADKYLAFQRGWRNNTTVPAYLRQQLPLDAGPALDVADKRVKAVFAMAPGIVRPSAWTKPGCDSSASRPISPSAPATPRRRPRTTPSSPRSTFPMRARCDPRPRRPRHLRQRCNEDGKNEFPQACVDAAGVDRATIHERVGNAAVKFFDAGLNVRRAK